MSEFQGFGLPIPRGDGVGQTADMIETDTPRTFVYHGARSGRFLVEASHDEKHWALLVGRDKAQAMFTGPRSITRTIDGVVRLLRVRAVGTRGVTPPPTLDVGAVTTTGVNVFETIPSAPDAGLGKVLDLGKHVGLEKTFILGGRVSSSTKLSILGSVDGERFGEIVRLPTGSHDRTISVAALCRFLRLERTGRDPGPVVTVGASGRLEPDEGGGGTGGDLSRQISLADQGAVGTDSTSEEVLREFIAPLIDIDGRQGFDVTLSGLFAAEGPSSASALFKVRLGGRLGRPDGDAILELEERSSGTPRSVVERVRMPIVMSPTVVKLTAKASARARAVVRGVVIAFHSRS